MDSGDGMRRPRTRGARVEPERMRAIPPSSGIGELRSAPPASHRVHPGPPELDEIVDRADQLELALHSVQATQREAAEAAALDLADDGFYGDLPLRVERAAALRPQSPAHPVGHTQPFGDAPAWRGAPRRPPPLPPHPHIR